MQKKMTDRTPGSYDDFVAYLGTVRTDLSLFSFSTHRIYFIIDSKRL